MDGTVTQSSANVTQRFAALPEKLRSDAYNFDHFRPRHLMEDTKRTLRTAGVRPGEAAPDFELLRAGGGALHLSELRGKPALLHFGSYT